MRLLILAFALCALVCFAKSEKKIVCYLGRWSYYRHAIGTFDIPNVDPNLCTHLIYAFAKLEDGVIMPHENWLDIADNNLDGYGKMYRLKEKNPNLKIMIALGGWNESENEPKYSVAMRTPEGRTKLANSIVDFVKKYRFDGFDLDWEYPVTRKGVPEDKENYILFLQELYPKLGKDGIALSVAVSPNIEKNALQYDIARLAKSVDFINLMTYDYHGDWDKALGHNSPIYSYPSDTGDNAIFNVDSTVKYWLQQGAPAEKLILGVSFYGHTFTMSNPNQPTLGSLADTGPQGKYTNLAGSIAYYELCQLFSEGGWTHVYDEIQKVPHAYKDKMWASYDDQGSLEIKASYMQKMNLGGMMVWSVDADDFRGICGMGSFPLLKNLNYVVRGGEKPSVPNYPMSTSKPDDSNKISYTTAVPPSHPAEPHTDAPHPSDGACTHEGYNRLKDDCSAFYYCQALPAGGYSALPINHCPNGLLFNTVNGACDWPKNVNC